MRPEILATQYVKTYSQISKKLKFPFTQDALKKFLENTDISVLEETTEIDTGIPEIDLSNAHGQGSVSVGPTENTMSLPNGLAVTITILKDNIKETRIGYCYNNCIRIYSENTGYIVSGNVHQVEYITEHTGSGDIEYAVRRSYNAEQDNRWRMPNNLYYIDLVLLTDKTLLINYNLPDDSSYIIKSIKFNFKEYTEELNTLPTFKPYLSYKAAKKELITPPKNLFGYITTITYKGEDYLITNTETFYEASDLAIYTPDMNTASTVYLAGGSLRRRIPLIYPLANNMGIVIYAGTVMHHSYDMKHWTHATYFPNKFPKLASDRISAVGDNVYIDFFDPPKYNYYTPEYYRLYTYNGKNVTSKPLELPTDLRDNDLNNAQAFDIKPFDPCITTATNALVHIARQYDYSHRLNVYMTSFLVQKFDVMQNNAYFHKYAYTYKGSDPYSDLVFSAAADIIQYDNSSELVVLSDITTEPLDRTYQIDIIDTNPNYSAGIKRSYEIATSSNRYYTDMRCTTGYQNERILGLIDSYGTPESIYNDRLHELRYIHWIILPIFFNNKYYVIFRNNNSYDFASFDASFKNEESIEEKIALGNNQDVKACKINNKLLITTAANLYIIHASDEIQTIPHSVTFSGAPYIRYSHGVYALIQDKTVIVSKDLENWEIINTEDSAYMTTACWNGLWIIGCKFCPNLFDTEKTFISIDYINLQEETT